ncbi:FAD-dependent oxidoreductase [Shinella kummerowiae]|jgi:succinate dehydrogenase/fumarate reductase flavoprotein subunit|uniref:FAD-dependent oxidoreductase n=1 Tax=Shinella kummerowiae TaxID=417745 RepID=A0A6N8SQK4_9HYPH|nr:FAD-dependent oxidoreductase [Shinella kummerowiae]MXN49292.1 FAD-dependent oxidoreductase [Shinella kummerowiae]
MTVPTGQTGTSEPDEAICPAETDVIVIGAGAAGLAAAVAAKDLGLDVVVLEKERHFGGTSALSGAAIWIPLHDGGKADDAASILAYLDALAEPCDRSRREAFVRHAGAALSFFQHCGALRYTPRAIAPDYHPELAGAVATGRVLDVAPFDGRSLGLRLNDLRPPLASHLVFGGMMVNRADVQTLLAFGREWIPTRRSLALLGRYCRDRLTGWKRGTRLVVGSALVAQLASALFGRGIPLVLNARVLQLTLADGQVSGADVAVGDGKRHIRARLAVILATGGFPGNPAMSLAERDPDIPHLSMASASSDGGGIALAQAVGGQLAETGSSAFFRAPVSVHRRGDEEIGRIAHLVLDRAKPGVIAVNKDGRRFTNEADSYHRFGTALSRLTPSAPQRPPAWLICDARALRRYGLGLARPFPAHLGNCRLIRDGYMIEAPTINALAKKLGLPGDTLSETLARHAEAAANGRDPDFGKGGSGHNRALGDPAIHPNPCLAPLNRPPFYAVGVVSGDLGTARGLRTDASARVLNAEGDAVPGLYAVGNDMHSIMGGSYPGPGTTLGPALVFAWIVANAIAKGDAP